MKNRRLETTPPSTPLARCPQAQENEANSQVGPIRGRVILFLRTAKSIFFNPVLLMTVLGVIGGVMFPNGLPVALASVLRVSNDWLF